MIYLILKMFVYLVIALTAGGAAGWLLRNQVANKREDDMQRVVNETKARVPQFESLMRGRDEQIKKLKYEIETKKKELGEAYQSLRDAEHEARERTRELKTAQHRNEALESGAGDDSALMGGGNAVGVGAAGEAADAAVAGYQREIADLKAQLESAKLEILQLDAMQGVPNESTDEPQGELETELERQVQAYQALSKELDRERDKVSELKRERELQNRSLQVLHQQLQIERERIEGSSAA